MQVGEIVEPGYPPNEAQRNAAVHACGVVDRPRLPELQAAAERAAAACQTPVALVTLVADERQWIAGSVGAEFQEMPRRYSFCAHAILTHDMTVVRDALDDPRFRSHPLVVRRPSMRFCAGAPLVDRDGHALGTVCVFDTRARELSAEQAGQLRAIAREVSTVLELRRTARSLQEAQRALAGERAMNGAIVAAALDAIVTVDESGAVLEFNPAAEALFGYTRDEALGQAIVDVIVPPRLRERHRAGFARVIAGGAPRILNRRFETEAMRRDGTEFPIELTVTPISVEPGVFTGHVRDLTERKRAEAAQHRLGAIVQSTQDAVVGLDLDRRVTHWNQGAEHLYGYAAAEMTGRTLDTIVPDELLGELEQALDRVLVGGEVARLETQRRTQDGRTVDVSISLSPIVDACGRQLGVSAIGRDIGDRRRLEARLRHEADHDPLTGLVNRRVFASRLEELTATRGTGERAAGAIILIDLDHFKLFNDSFGHRAGDEVLCAVAAALRMGIAEDAIVARLGADEFGVLLPDCSDDEAVRVADGLIADIARVSGAHEGGASAGVSSITCGIDAQDVMAAADMALYEAKTTGRRRVVHHRGRRESTLQGVVAVREAIAAGRLALHAQPIVDLGTGEVDSHELLVRMLDPDGRLIAPGQFIPIAERFGLIEQIDRWVLQRACEHARRGMRVSVNLSAHTIANPATAALVTRRIDDGLAPDRLTFEITETAALYDMESARQFASGLAALGCGLALDDFGTGFGSLLHLKHLPVTRLKIDREFVAQLITEPTDRHIIEGLVGIARALRVSTVAEGVEDAATLELLRDLGIDLAQGYHIARPAPIETIAG